MLRSLALAFVIKEFEEILSPTLFFAVGFNLIVLTTRLVLDLYLFRIANLGCAGSGKGLDTVHHQSRGDDDVH